MKIFLSPPATLRRFISLSLLSVVALSSCSLSESDNDTVVSGAREATITITQLTSETIRLPRSTAPLGVFVSLYLAQGAFIPVRSAVEGVEAGMLLLITKENIDIDATYLLLQEFATILQVKVPDLLNESIDRADTLTRFTETLSAATDRAQGKLTELEVLIEAQRDSEDEQQDIVSDLEKQIRTATREEKYSTAAALQPSLAEEETTLAERERELEESRETAEIFEDLLKIAQDRLIAIQTNREVLIAGLTVVDVPGIDDLSILERGGRRRSSGGSGFEELRTLPF